MRERSPGMTVIGSFVDGGAAVMDAVEPVDEGNVGGAVGIILDKLDDAHGERCHIALEVDGPLEAFHSAVVVEGGYAAVGGLLSRS